jgi:hypothetical protein
MLDQRPHVPFEVAQGSQGLGPLICALSQEIECFLTELIYRPHRSSKSDIMTTTREGDADAALLDVTPPF